MQTRPAVRAFGNARQFIADGLVALRGKAKRARQSVDIEPRAAADDGQASALPDLFDADKRPLAVGRGAAFFAGRKDAEHVMRDAAHLPRCGHGREYVHAAIDLHGVGGDDLSARAQGERDGNGGLSRSRRPGDDRKQRPSQGNPPLLDAAEHALDLPAGKRLDHRPAVRTGRRRAGGLHLRKQRLDL